jgi:hypothetical protein
MIHGTFMINHCKFTSLNEHFFIVVSFKQRIYDANKFGSSRIFSKCNVKERVLRDYIIMFFEQ